MKIAQCIALGAVSALILAAAAADSPGSFAPGSRTTILSHNAYPDHGKYTDRIDRAIAAGLPVAIEQDLSWVDGKSLMIHGKKNVGTDDPTLDSYFIPRVKPVIEKALKSGKKDHWPLVILYLDIKNDPPEHLQAINKWLDQYNHWLTTAEKTADITRQSPLDLKPMMVLVEDKDNDIKQQYFYDNVPVGGRIRVFGSVTKFDENPQKLPRERKAEAVALMSGVEPEQLIKHKADNYHRWFGTNWAFVEKGGETASGDWTPGSESRLKEFVDYGHKMGYFVGFYCLDGYTAEENQGWDKDYNFGSREKVMPRWQAALRAHADFISTDQMEAVAAVKTAQTAADYKVKQAVPVPGNSGWDYLSVDAEARRVYVSHGIQVDVLDADELKPVGTISPTLGVHGIAVAPKLNKGFISAGQSNDVAVFDLKTREITSRIPTGKKPDGIIFDGSSKRVIVSNGGSGSATIIDAEQGKVIGDIELGGKPEFAAADGKGKVFINLEDKNEMVRIDLAAMKVEARYALAPCEGPSALAMDRAARRLFVGCHNNMMAVVNADTGAVLQSAPIGAHVDAATFDKSAKTVFFSCGDGTVSMFVEETPDKLVSAGTVATEPGAKTLALDSKTHNLFLSVAKRDGKTVQPGTFHVLVCSR